MSRIALVFLLAVASPSWALDRTELYVQAVHILGGNANVISRWDEPMRFAVVDGGRATPARRIVEEAGAIAGLELHFPVNEVSAPADYLQLLRSTPPFALGPACPGNGAISCFNFVVVLASNEQMRAIAEAVPLPPEYLQLLRDDPQLHCYFAPFRNGRRQIRQVMVYVRDDLDAAMLDTCLHEEIYQAFGLFNDVTGSEIFSFNNVVAPKQITAYDRLLLATLYGAQVKPGYPVNFVAELFMKRAGYPLH